jgi:hypothetical protein
VIRKAFSMFAAVAAAGCASPAKAPLPPPVPLHLEPACGVVPSAGLSWIADVRPRELASIPDLIPAIALVLPEERLRAFAEARGGIDLRQMHELCIAQYADSRIAVARVPLDPERVARAFEERSVRPAVRTTIVPLPRVIDLVGESHEGPEEALVFGNEAVALEEGRPPRGSRLRAVEAFALGKLKRAQPALRGAALARAADALGAAPVRVLAPGPFEGESGRALGGLLRAATAIGGSARWNGGASLDVRIIVTGAWGDDAKAAGERLAAAVHVLSESAVGHLLGLHKPIHGPTVRTETEALVLEATLDANRLARGVRDAVMADVAEILGPRPR